MDNTDMQKYMVSYFSGDLSPAEKEFMEAAFLSNAALKEEAEQMQEIWHKLDSLYNDREMPVAGDTTFYNMLESEKAAIDADVHIQVRYRRVLWQVAAAALVFLTAFGVWRFAFRNINPAIKYQTFKSPVIKERIVSRVIIPKVKRLALSKTKKKIAKKRMQAATENGLYGNLASERLAAVIALSGKGRPGPKTMRLFIRTLERDANTNVRLAALEALRPFSGKCEVQVSLIRAMSLQNDEIVRRSIIDLLLDTGAKQALPPMLAMLDNNNIDPLTQEKIRAGIDKLLN